MYFLMFLMSIDMRKRVNGLNYLCDRVQSAAGLNKMLLKKHNTFLGS